MHFIDLKETVKKQLAPGVNLNLAWGDKLMLSVVELEPGSTVPMHSHPHEQAGIVLEDERAAVFARPEDRAFETKRAGQIFLGRDEAIQGGGGTHHRRNLRRAGPEGDDGKGNQRTKERY